MDLVVACVLLPVDVLVAVVSVEVLLVVTVGLADVVGDVVEVLITVLVLVAGLCVDALAVEMVELAVVGVTDDVLAEVIGVVVVVVVVTVLGLVDMDMVVLLVVSGSVRSSERREN